MKDNLCLYWATAILLLGISSCNEPASEERIVPANVAIRVGVGEQVMLADSLLMVTYNGPAGIDYFTFEIGENGSGSSYGLGQGQTAAVGAELNYLLTLEEADDASATIRLNPELDLGPLLFETETLGSAYNLFQQCAAVANSTTVTVHPLVRTPFFVSGRQCSGTGSNPGCDYEAIEVSDRNFSLINLDAEYLQSNAQTYVGVRLRAVSIPENEGWSSRINYRDKSYDDEPAGWSLSFSQYSDTDQPTLTIRLGPALTYSLNDTVISTSPSAEPLESMLATLESPDELALAGEQYIKTLLTAIRSQAAAGTEICAPVTPADDNATTPECIYRDATAAETATALQMAELELLAQIEALKSNSDTLHAATSALMPFAECSP